MLHQIRPGYIYLVLSDTAGEVLSFDGMCFCLSINMIARKLLAVVVKLSEWIGYRIMPLNFRPNSAKIQIIE